LELLYFILASYGLTQILVYGSIFQKQREYILEKSQWLGKLIHCPMCTGYWAGVFLFGINDFTELFTFDYNIANLLILGWLSSGTSYILSILFDDSGLKITGGKNETLEIATRQKML
jgi:hypothetical protein|tara:strand:- start:225 stop:575 length:351 start_codon:yes stop_codon:yes gene_type:complete